MENVKQGIIINRRLYMDETGILKEENLEETEQLSARDRIIGVFISPRKVMKSLAKNPKILLPIIISIIVPLIALVLNYSVFKDALMSAMETELANMGEELTPDMMKLLGIIGVMGTIIGAVGTVLMDLLVISLALLGIIKILKGKGSFRQYLSVVSHAGLIVLLIFIVTTIVSNISGKLDLNVSITSLAAVLPKSLQGSFIYAVLNNVEFFNIWQYCVVGIGVSEVSGLGKSKSYAIVATVYFATLLLAGVMSVI